MQRPSSINASCNVGDLEIVNIVIIDIKVGGISSWEASAIVGFHFLLDIHVSKSYTETQSYLFNLSS